MKHFLFFFLLIPIIAFSQVPQGVATDLNGVELINQTISIQASVLSSSATGNVEWQEEHSVTTDIVNENKPKSDYLNIIYE